MGRAAWLACCLGHGALAPIGPDDVAALAAELKEGRHPAGTTIFAQGEAPSSVHILVRGYRGHGQLRAKTLGTQPFRSRCRPRWPRR